HRPPRKVVRACPGAWSAFSGERPMGVASRRADQRYGAWRCASRHGAARRATSAVTTSALHAGTRSRRQRPPRSRRGWASSGPGGAGITVPGCSFAVVLGNRLGVQLPHHVLRRLLARLPLLGGMAHPLLHPAAGDLLVLADLALPV